MPQETVRIFGFEVPLTRTTKVPMGCLIVFNKDDSYTVSDPLVGVVAFPADGGEFRREILGDV